MHFWPGLLTASALGGKYVLVVGPQWPPDLGLREWQRRPAARTQKLLGPKRRRLPFRRMVGQPSLRCVGRFSVLVNVAERRWGNPSLIFSPHGSRALFMPSASRALSEGSGVPPQDPAPGHADRRREAWGRSLLPCRCGLLPLLSRSPQSLYGVRYAVDFAGDPGLSQMLSSPRSSGQEANLRNQRAGVHQLRGCHGEPDIFSAIQRGGGPVRVRQTSPFPLYVSETGRWRQVMLHARLP